MSDQPKLSVLAVLDSLIAEYEFTGEVVEARAAVAELIDAAKTVVTINAEWARSELADALVRVRGES